MPDTSKTEPQLKVADYTVHSAEGQRAAYQVGTKAELAALLATRVGAARQIASSRRRP